MALPSVDTLRCFVAAAEHLNFRRAAREVALTPAALGQRIRQLEDELGAALFYRTTRSVELTSAGHALLPAARDALTALRRCSEAISDVSGPLRFVLGTRFELGLSWVAPSVLAWRAVEPKVEVDLYFGAGADIVDRLAYGLVDAIITSAPVMRDGWTAEPLHPEHYVLVGAPTLLDARPLACVADAAAHTLVDIDRTLPLGRYLLSAAPGLDFARVTACGAGAAVRQFILSGQGVAVLPRYMVERDLVTGTLQALLPEVPLLHDTFRLMFRREHPAAPVLVRLAAFLRQQPLR
jgi:DNA-binding transcriptional LysR family regulator